MFGLFVQEPKLKVARKGAVRPRKVLKAERKNADEDSPQKNQVGEEFKLDCLTAHNLFL